MKLYGNYFFIGSFHLFCGYNASYFALSVQFFSPLVTASIELVYGDDGRAAGDANVAFSTYRDALDAMKKVGVEEQCRLLQIQGCTGRHEEDGCL